jgi:hypothetical protein
MTMANLEVNTPRIVWDRADGEVVALDCVAGIYYRLNPAASDVWEAIDAGATVERLEANGVTPADLQEFLAHLTAAEFLRDRTESIANVDIDIAFRGGNLEFERFDDLQEVLEADPIHEVEPGRGWTLGR